VSKVVFSQEPFLSEQNGSLVSPILPTSITFLWKLESIKFSKTEVHIVPGNKFKNSVCVAMFTLCLFVKVEYVKES
jgi:hypothetical protein